MPIYEYACPKCGEFEVTQRITEDPLKKCPTCKSKVRKLISNTSFQLKGSGWYATDYAQEGPAGQGRRPARTAARRAATASRSDGSASETSRRRLERVEGEDTASKTA